MFHFFSLLRLSSSYQSIKICICFFSIQTKQTSVNRYFFLSSSVPSISFHAATHWLHTIQYIQKRNRKKLFFCFNANYRYHYKQRILNFELVRFETSLYTGQFIFIRNSIYVYVVVYPTFFFLFLK